MNRATKIKQMLARGGMKYASQFNGNNQYIGYGVNAYDLGVQRNATFCAWFKSDNLTASGAGDIISDYGSTAGGMSLRHINTSAECYVYPNNLRITINNAIAVNTWYHIAMIMDGDNNVLRLMLNGTQIGSRSLPSDVGDSVADLKIGCRGDTNSNTFFSGIISDARIYSRATSMDEMSLLSTGHPISSVGLVAHWPLVEGTGLTANDISGNGNHGSLLPALNPPTWTTDTPL